MQVLVALAGADGAVVSREDLISRCWDGRIVGENAINRVISRVRSLGATLGDGAFRIETINKVGYRLILDGAAADPPAMGPPGAAPWRSTPRRAVLGGAVSLAAVAGTYAWFAMRPRPPSPEALALYRKGLDAQRQGLSDETAQATAFLQEAVRISPAYGDAWGALALSYRHRLENDPTVDEAVVAGWVAAAADRALQLDPANADAEIAKILIKPHYRNWTACEHAYRVVLKRHPAHWLMRGTFGRLMYEVGRWSEGLEPFRANIAAEPFLPLSRFFLALGLWNSGRWHEAESTLEAAFARWPTHPAIWTLRFQFLAQTGRPAAAIAFANDAQARPFGVPERQFMAMTAFARAIETGADRDIEPVVTSALEAAMHGPGELPDAVQTLAVLGRVDMAFALIDNYFLGKGVVGVPPAKIGPLTRRSTAFLFTQQTVALRADPRFTLLTKTIGLEEYWRASGSVPDFRRPSLDPRARK
jgi:Tfp pilus assembly protein PilF